MIVIRSAALCLCAVLAAVSFSQSIVVGASGMPSMRTSVGIPYIGDATNDRSAALYKGGDFEGALTAAAVSHSVNPLSASRSAILSLSVSASTEPKALRSSLALSRRDTLASGLNILLEANGGSLKSALSVINQQATVRPILIPQMMPTVVPLLEQPDAIPLFSELLSDPDIVWRDAFLREAARTDNLLDKAFELRSNIESSASVEPETDIALMRSLLRAGRVNHAFILYTELEESTVDSFQTNWPTQFPPFDWSFKTVKDGWARLDNQAQYLEINLAPGTGGILASRIVRVTDASARLAVKGRTAKLSDRDRFEAEVSCLAEKKPLARLSLSERPNSTIDFDKNTCDFVQLVVSGRAWSTGSGLQASLRHLRLTGVEEPTVQDGSK